MMQCWCERPWCGPWVEAGRASFSGPCRSDCKAQTLEAVREQGQAFGRWLTTQVFLSERTRGSVPGLILHLGFDGNRLPPKHIPYLGPPPRAWHEQSLMLGPPTGWGSRWPSGDRACSCLDMQAEAPEGVTPKKGSPVNMEKSGRLFPHQRQYQRTVGRALPEESILRHLLNLWSRQVTNPYP